MSKKERYHQNRERVFSIYGIDPNDKRFSCHHILFRSDFKTHPEWDQKYQDSKANLIPLTKEEHLRLHQRVDEMEKKR